MRRYEKQGRALALILASSRPRCFSSRREPARTRGGKGRGDKTYPPLPIMRTPAGQPDISPRAGEERTRSRAVSAASICLRAYIRAPRQNVEAGARAEDARRDGDGDGGLVATVALTLRITVPPAVDYETRAQRDGRGVNPSSTTRRSKTLLSRCATHPPATRRPINWRHYSPT